MQKNLLLILTFLITFFGKAQQADTISIRNKSLKFTVKQLYIPTGLMLAGTGILIAEKRDAVYTGVKKYGFGSYAEDYIQFTPLLANSAFDLAGMKGRTDRINKLAIGIKTGLILSATNFVLKYSTHKIRPDGSNYHGFPSAHTATAFAGATTLTTEYGENYPWVPYAAYGVAYGVGVLRVVHDKHYWSDVVFGAGLGILSSKLAYWTHQYHWNKSETKKDAFAGVIYP